MLRNILEKHKPSKVFLDTGKNVAYFIIDGKQSKLDLGNADTTSKFQTLLHNLPQKVQEVTQQGLPGYVLDWNFKPTEVQPVIQQQTMGQALQKETPQQEQQPTQPTKTFNVSLTENSSREDIFQVIDNIIQREELLQVIISNNGTFIKDGKVSNVDFLKTPAKTIYDHYSQEEANAVGTIKRDIEVNGTNYAIHLWKVGDEISVRFSRQVANIEDLVMVMPSEMKHRHKQLNSGLIVTTVNSLINMEHIIPMMKEIDTNFLKTACSIGDNLVITEITTQESNNNIGMFKDTQYKYLFMKGIDTPEQLDKVMELIYAGKTVILGFDNDSVYANLISLLSLCNSDNFTMNKVLMSTIGFIHPVVTLKDNSLSLEDTECVTLSSRNAQRIIEGELSKEKFDMLIDRPSKVYSLGTGNNSFITQEEELQGLLKLAVERGASDIHLAVGASPLFRIAGKLVPIDKDIKLKPEVLNQIASLLVTTEFQKSQLEEFKDIYMPYSAYGVGRFRVQISTQRGTKYIVIRHTALKIPSAEEMRIPQILIDVVKQNPKGLVIVTGPTGSGKSTTSAILIDELKKHGQYAITSLADPIEFLHSHGDGVVTQREIPSDVHSFERGLLSVFRSDPDIIEIGEMRSTESVEATMRLANSGHLVITTYHTSSVKGTIEALKNKVDAERQDELISTLSQNVIAIINQTLVEGKNGKLVPIFEYLIPNRNIRHYIAEGKTNSIDSEMKSSARADKSVATWADYELLEAFDRGEITKETLHKHLNDKNAKNDFKGAL